MKKKLLIILLLLGIKTSIKAQTADLMDVRFQSNGIAKNISSLALPITTPVKTPETVYEPTIKQFVSRFTPTSSNTDIYYKMDYSQSDAFKQAISSAFSIEVYIKANSNKNMCAVSAQESGGFGIEQAGNGGNTQFWYNSTAGTIKPGNQSIYSAVNPAFYHIVFTSDGSTIKAYYNGIQNGSAAINGTYKAPADVLAHWVAIGGDANNVPANNAQFSWNGDIAFSRIYSSTLTPTQVSDLYAAIQTRATLTNVGDLNVILTQKLVSFISFTTDPVKKTKAEELLAEGWNLMGNMATTDANIQTYFNKITTQLGSIEPAVSIYPNFAVISDTHVGSSNDWNTKVNRAIDQFLTQQTKLDAVFVVGDITDWGNQSQYTDAKNTFARLQSQVPVYFLMGNHDWYDSSTSGDKFDAAFGQARNQYVEIKGYPFITISMESSNYANAYQTTSQNFLTQSIATAKANCPGKPIFLFVHMGASGTVYGTNSNDGNWGTSGLKAICEANSELIVFSGHSHYPIGDERSIHQDKFTSINDGSLTYAEIESGYSEGIHPANYKDVTEGAFVSIENNGDVKVKKWDFTRKEEIKTPWIIKAPFSVASFSYTNRTGGTAPYFQNGDLPVVNNITDNSCVVNFPQAKDDDLVHHYAIELMDENNVILNSPKYTVFSGFYLNSAMPGSLSWTISGLNSSKKYYVRVTGIDSYGNISTPPIKSAVFITNNFQIDPNAVAATPDLLNVNFRADGNAVDLSAKKFAITKGSTSPKTLYDSTIKQFINRAEGSTSQFFKIDYQNDASFKTTLQSAFTIETYIKSNSSTNICPVSSQESGGFGIEQAANGATQFWFGAASGGYKTIGSTKIYNSANPQYYHVVFTYDGTTLTSYYNGVKTDELNPGSALRFSSTAAAQWIAIGGDANGGANAQYAYIGDIGATRMYGKALSRDEVYLAYQQMITRAAMSNVDDLKNALIVTIPDQIIAHPEIKAQLEALQTQGWELMGNMTTTETQISSFLQQLYTTLPVVLSSFNAKSTGSKVYLDWKTTSEQNSKYFEILRNIDGKSFTPIGRLNAAGNSNTEKSYHFVDYNPAKGTNYYQLKQYDNDSSLSVQSKIVSANILSAGMDLKVSVTNQTSLTAHIYSPNNNSGTLVVTTVSGNKIANIPIILSEGNNKYEVPVNAATGLLIVTLYTPQGKLSQKVIK